MEKDTAYTQALEQHLQQEHPDNAGQLKRHYDPDALATAQQERQAVPLVDPQHLEGQNRSTPFPLPNPLGLMPSVFAMPVPVSAIPLVTLQLLPQILTGKMAVMNQDQEPKAHGIPVGIGGGERLGGMKKDDAAGKPHTESVGEHASVQKPVVETFPAGNKPQVTTETFPSDPRATNAGPTVLMAKKSDNDKRQMHSQKVLEQELGQAERIGSAQKDDSQHRSATFGTQGDTKIHELGFVGNDGKNYVLYQRKGVMNDSSGIFEYIKNEDGQITHQRFIEGGVITKTPNQSVRKQ